MHIVIITPNSIYIYNTVTRTLCDNNGNEITHGFLRTMLYMSRQNIIAVKNFDTNGNCVYSKESRKVFA